MSYAEVRALFGEDGAEVTSGGRENGVVRWQRPSGNNVQVRFRDGKVVRAATQTPDSGALAAPVATVITQAQYDGVTQGMSLYEVSEFLDVEGRVVTDSGEKQVYRWQDESGASFSARFEQGKLTRKSNLFVPEPAEGEGEPEGNGETDAMAEEGAFEFEGDAFEGEGESEAAPPERGRLVFNRQGVYEADSPAEARSQAEERAPQAVRLGSRVVGTGRADDGGNRPARAAAETERREQRRREQLPRYSHSLERGVYEVKIVNESESDVQVGLRQGKRGRDASVSARGDASIFVDRGSYSLYYVLRDAPYELESGSVSIDGQEMPDIEIRIRDDGYSVVPLDQPIFY